MPPQYQQLQTAIQQRTFTVNGTTYPIYRFVPDGVQCIASTASSLIEANQFSKENLSAILTPTLTNCRGTWDIDRHEGPDTKSKLSSHRQKLELYKTRLQSPIVTKFQPIHENQEAQIKSRFVQKHFCSMRGLSCDVMRELQVMENQIYPSNHLHMVDHLSETSQSEMETLLADLYREKVMDILRQSRWFGLLLDESTDSSNRAILLVSAHIFEEQNKKHIFLGIRELGEEGGTGQNIAAKIMEILTHFQLHQKTCVGIATDGAAAMIGSLKGAATLL
ncbi:hypothetical protein BLNAU_2283 [Blattamonas nauphoetae]|uniref:DUF4371 domain-containing protein n=1 Tax=Blattamonas nauphoetae TaxID=2049346 RepID=A0ABQ9YGG5_9EUKA|nr:hypothetical protein BLNAU_2283 [Blattamonas nauphoetae]